ncbi:hypothetical protein ACLB2K_048718 [Fragaria x ananassa]
MVAFGKKLKERQIEEWKGYYINYKLMKKKVKRYAQQIKDGTLDRRHVLKDFSMMLDNQIETIVLFMLEQQGLLASRIAKLGERHDALQQQPDISQIVELREAYRQVGRDLLKLLFFVEINAIGLRKILKKFDKRFGYRFTDYYVKTRANHPYSQLQQVFKHVGVGAVVGAVSRNLHELQDRQGSYLSIYDQPSLPLQDPVVDSIKAAVDRLTHSTNFLSFLGQHALILQEEFPTPVEEQADDQRYHFNSLLLNLANTFLYMVNTYIIVPTADDYSISLGAAATVCGVVIGAMAVAQVFSSVYFSAWSNRSYFKPLVFSSIVLFAGNGLYAMAYDLNSIWVLLIGRLLCGFGSARAVNRRYISDCVPLRIRMQASAGFVSASALGMACGPALAGLLQTDFKIYKLTFNQDTLPGWVMAVAWVLYLIWLCISFKEPVREDDDTPVETNGGQAENDALEKGLKKPLLVASENKNEDEDDDLDIDESEEAVDESRRPATSIGSAYRLLTPSVKVQLLIYFMLKYAMEILLSESSVVTTYYFNWSTSSVAIFLASLGLTVLPVNILVGSYISNMFEDRQILLASEILVFLGIVLSFNVIVPYTVAQYVVSGLIMFVSAEVLEGVNLSLLSRVMSSRLSRGTYNGGLLSTEAGTLARVVADGTITLSGYLGDTRDRWTLIELCRVYKRKRRHQDWCLVLQFSSFLASATPTHTAPNFTFIHNARRAPAISYYDYIIVGGGTAGCPLAATLSQNASVLLLERGGSPYGNPNITNLDAFGASLADLSPTSPSQRFVSEDGVINARARVLGGGSCLNAGFYTRAATDYVSEAGWDGRLVNQSYEWVEQLVAFRPPIRGWQSAVRDGLLEAGVVPNNGFTYDHIYGTKVGGTIFYVEGHRHTAADLLEYADSTRLTVLLHATVHKILFRTRGKARPLAHGVAFRDASGAQHSAYLKEGSNNEIIISAGAIGSPQMLMLSGVGPEEPLKAHNITVVLTPVEVSLIQVVGITRFGSYIEAAGGENFSPRNYGMLSPKIGQLSTLPPKQRTPEALAEAVEFMNSLDERAFKGGFILEKILGPVSTGHLELQTLNPNDNPSVTFNYFQDPVDLERCVQGLRTIEKLVDSKAFSNFRFDNMSIPTLLNNTVRAPINLLPKHENSSRSLEQFCKDTVMTIWHYHGGCQVGRVVDQQYKVLGVDALRVIDGSTFNYSPGTNPQATVMMLGRYMGQIILNKRLAADESK